jgi:T3SS negative regulator,GrlR
VSVISTLIDGLWTAKIQAGGNSTSGVMVFANGRVLSGDSGFVWTGTFKVSGCSVKADIHVKNYDPRIPPRVFGVTEHDVSMYGIIKGESISATGGSPAYQGVNVSLVLTKRAAL